MATTYKFSDLKQALKQRKPADVVNDIVAHLSAADINKAVKTFDPGLEVALFNALTTESLQKVAQSLDPSVAGGLVNLPPEFLAFTQPSYADTAAADTFVDAVGTFQATDINSNVLTYGVAGATATSVTVAGVSYNQVADSDYGCLLLNTATGAYRFMTDADAINALSTAASANFTITVSDGKLTATQSFSIAIAGANDAPVAANGTTSVDEDNSIAGGLLPAATDAEGDTLAYALGSVNAAHGSVTVHANGTFDYTPNSNFEGTDTFSFVVTDAQGASSEYTHSVVVNPVNDAPAITSVAPAATPNLIVNGSFENGSAFVGPAAGRINPWQVGGSVDYISWSLNQRFPGNVWQAADGDRSLDMSGESAGSVQQSFATVAGALYAVRFSLAANTYFEEVNKLRVSVGPGTEQLYTFDATGHTETAPGWTDYSFTFVATGSSTTLSFTSIEDATTGWGFAGTSIDQVSVTTQAIRILEDTPTKLSGISVSDVDAGGNAVTVTLALPDSSHGALSATSFGGVIVDGTATTLTLTGTVAAINAFLADASQGVTYSPAANDTTGVLLSLTVNDNGGSGAGGAFSAAQTVVLDIIPVDGAPVFTSAASSSVLENIATTGVVYDANATSSKGAIVYSLEGGADDHHFTIDPSTGFVRFKASADYENPQDAGRNNVYDILVRAWDGGAYSDREVAIAVGDVVSQAPTDLRLNVVNVASVPAGTGTAQGAIIGSLSVPSFDVGDSHSFAIINDPSNRFEIVDDSVLKLTAGVSIVQGDNPIPLTVSFTSTLGSYYETITVVPGSGLSETLNGTETGGSGTQASPYVGDDVIFAFNGNDTLNTAGPMIGTSGDDALFGGAANDQLFGGAGNDQLVGGTLNDSFFLLAPATNGTDTILDLRQAAADRVALLQGGGGWDAAVTSTSTGAALALSSGDYVNRNSVTDIAASDTNKVVELQFTQSGADITGASGAAANAYVVVFNSTTVRGELWHDSDWSDAANRTQLATFDDVTAVSTLTAFSNAKFLEWAPNEAPVLDAKGGSLKYTENQADTAINPLLTIGDIDSSNLINATVKISGNFVAGQDVLSFTDQNGIFGSYNVDNGVLTLSGTSSVANYEAALRSVTYFNSSDNPSVATRTISYQADDGRARNHASNIATATVSVTPLNDAPVAQDDLVGRLGGGWVLNPDNGHYYRLVVVNGGVPWTSAMAAASSEGAYLATITSGAENDFVHALAGSNGAWLGGYGSTAANLTTWRWVTGPETGAALTYQNWNSGEPNGGLGASDAALHMMPNGSWNDVPTAWGPGNGALQAYVEEWGGQIELHDGGSATIAAAVLLGNDTDVDSGSLFVSSVNAASALGGSVVLNGGVITYQPAEGFTGVDSFTYTVSDGTLTSTGTVNVVVNNAPVITSQDLTGAVTALPAVVSTSPVFTVQQFTGFQSNDLYALRNYAATHAANYTVQTNVIDYSDQGQVGQTPDGFQWPAAQALNFIGNGGVNDVFFARITANFAVTTADTYTFRTFNDDGVFLLIDNNVVIQDTGYHPEAESTGSIALTPGNHSIELFFYENGGEAALELSARNSTGPYALIGTLGSGIFDQIKDSGTISFTDVDLPDAHLVSATGTPIGSVLGSLKAVKNSDTTGTGTGGQLTWTYSVANSAIGYLAAGETKVESFNITLDDQRGSLITKQIDVTLKGTNDAAVISSPTILMDRTHNDGSFESNSVITKPAPTELPPVWSIGSTGLGGLLGKPGHTTVLAGADGADAIFADGPSTQSTTATSQNLLGGGYSAVHEGDVFAWSFQINSWSATSTGVLKLNFGGADVMVGTGNAGDNDLATYRTISGTYTATAADAAGGQLHAILSIVTGTPGVGGNNNVYGDNVQLSVLSTTVPVQRLIEADTPAAISTSGTLTITDIDSPATFVAQAGTVGDYGTFAIGANGLWTYTASLAHDEFVAGTTYTDTFAVRSADGTPSAVTINIAGTNDAPVAANDTLAADEDTPFTFTAAALLGNDTDPENANLTAIVVDGPDHGDLSVNADGTFTYTPDADYSGDDSFTYQASDGIALSNIATAQITIHPADLLLV